MAGLIRPLGLRGRRAPFVALAVVLAVGLLTGLALDRTELRGVTVEVPAPPPAPEQIAIADTATPQPESFAEAFEAGLNHMRAGDAHAAALAFDAARRADPHAVAAYVNLGFASLELGRPAAARAAFEQATEIVPAQANAYYGMAEALEALGDTEGALGAMRTYLHLTPEEDPFRRRAMSAIWEWEASLAAVRAEAEATQAASPVQDAPTGIPIYDAALQTLDGAPATLAAHRGKIIVLNVWAVWCGPCRAELPSLDRLSAALDPSAFSVLGVSIDKQREFTREFLAELGVGFPSYWDGAGKLTAEILATRAVPLTVIIDREGNIVVAYEGARDWSEPEMIAAIAGLDGGGAPFDQRVAKLLEELR
ncbi:MAG TPA: TlpA disulfide reductase family protein [Thermohalobaculum sp.]|nr:TlpA disulfide reductase family protein [Thermohalobaculum sp.]